MSEDLAQQLESSLKSLTQKLNRRTAQIDIQNLEIKQLTEKLTASENRIKELCQIPEHCHQETKTEIQQKQLIYQLEQENISLKKEMSDRDNNLGKLAKKTIKAMNTITDGHKEINKMLTDLQQENLSLKCQVYNLKEKLEYYEK